MMLPFLFAIREGLTWETGSPRKRSPASLNRLLSDSIDWYPESSRDRTLSRHKSDSLLHLLRVTLLPEKVSEGFPIGP